MAKEALGLLSPCWHLMSSCRHSKYPLLKTKCALTVGDQHLVQPHSKMAGLCTGLESRLGENCFPPLSRGIQKLRYSFSFLKTAVKYNSGAQQYWSLETVKYFGQDESSGKNRNCSSDQSNGGHPGLPGYQAKHGACGGTAFSYSIIWNTLGLHEQNGEDKKNSKSHYPGILAWLGRLSSSFALVDCYLP